MDLRKTVKKLSRQTKCLDSTNNKNSFDNNKANKNADNLSPEDIISWKNTLNLQEKDTLQSVTDRGNTITNPIKLKRSYTSTSGEKNDVFVDIYFKGKENESDGNIIIGNKPNDFTENNPKGKNLIVATGTPYSMDNSEYNSIYGYYAITNNIPNSKTNFFGNTIFGSGNFNSTPKLSNNVLIGFNNSVFNGNFVIPADTNYYPIWGNLFNGDYTNNAWGSLYNNTFNRQAYENYLKNSLKIIDDNLNCGPFHNTIIGNGLSLGTGNLRANAYQSIWIGSNVLQSGFAYRFVGNIFMGNEIYAEHPHDRPAGAIVIGNYLKISGRHTLGELAIHNSTHQPTNWNDALIRGNFNTRYLKINGKFQINPNYTESYNELVHTKQVVAKPDGTLTLKDLKEEPTIKILQQDYTPTENLEYLDVFTFNLKANTTYKLELGLFGDERILSQCIITNDVGNLSVLTKFLVDTTGSWCFYLGSEEELQQRNLFHEGLPYNNKSTILNYVIRPKSDCFIKIPTKRFSTIPTNSKLLAGTYMKIEPIK